MPAVAAMNRRTALALAACGAACPQAAKGQQRPNKLVFVFSRPPTNSRTQWLLRIYTEALGRMGIAFEYLDVPPSRATALSSAGAVDGELGRTYEFAELFPTLVRVEEPNNTVLFSAFAMTPQPPIAGWEDLRRSTRTLGYRHGIKEIEEELRHEAYQGRTTGVSNLPAGVMMLSRGRIDLYLEVQDPVEEYLTSPEGKRDLPQGTRPLRVGILQRTTGHAYLHERHRALAPELATVLRQMKAEGLHARYLAEILGDTPIPEGFPGHVPRS